MKKIYVVLICVLVTVLVSAQTRCISYQALIINPQDEEAPGFNGKQTPLVNKEVCLRFSFLDSSDKVEYQEIQKIKTDEFGMVNLMIGMGKYSAGYIDSFKNINWDGSTKRLKVELDVKNDCREFEEISNQVLAYVPFAFYALNSPASKIPGPKGDTGLGIKEVKRIQDTLFIKLTNDSLINLGNIKGNKGDQGIQGNNGTDGVSITNAKVESDSLKITLSNGLVINSGYVKGNKGDTGIQGKTGLNGISMVKTEVKKDSLWIMLSDSSIQNAGYVKGNKGDTGVSGANGISVTNSQVINDSLKVTLSNGTIINAGYVKGNTGAQGAQGIQGLTGATGPQGPMGATGAQGPAGTNGVNVTNSQVINDSLKLTLSNGTLINAGYVKGNTGAQGLQGIQGLTGATGPQGATGIQGPAGTNGISVTNTQVINDSLKLTLSNGTIINAGYVKGNIGAQGPQGPAGSTGSQGPAGTNGISVTNTQVLNDSLKVTLSNGTIINAGYVKGNTGAQGIQGLTGATGPQGPAGTNGISVTNSQVINDSLKVTLSNGTVINAGYVKGNTGAQGPQGIQGLTGATGVQGPAGTNGISVTNSQVVNDSLKVTLSNGTIINAGYVKGNTGAQGPQGIQGLTGATGPQGPTGATGSQGLAGTNGISVTNSQVINDSLKVTLSNGTVINAGYVKGNTGAQGPQGIQGLTGATGVQGPAGTNGISVTNSQVVNDSLKVTLSNGTIINAGYVRGSAGAQGPQGIQGLTGAQGPQGPIGATGLQGPAGTNGISVTISQVVNDSLKVTLSNGTVINAGYVKGNTGAQGPQGIQGLTGSQGPAGTNGISVTNSQVINDSLKVILSNGTVINTGYVKGNTGPTGLSGINPLIKTTNEPAGVNCSDGGVKIEVGLDTNRNNILDNSEINSSQTKYVCNGSFNSSNSLNIPSKSWYQLNQLINTVPQNSVYYNFSEQSLVIKSNSDINSCGSGISFSSITTIMANNQEYIISFQVSDTAILTEYGNPSNFTWDLFVDDNNINNGLGIFSVSSKSNCCGFDRLNYVLIPNETYRLRMNVSTISSTINIGNVSSITYTGTCSGLITNTQFHIFNSLNNSYLLSSQAPQFLHLGMKKFKSINPIWRKL